MKKFICLLLPFILLIGGCSSNKHELIKEDGNYYIRYDTSSVQTSTMGQEVMYVIYYKSVKDMKDAILNVKFTDEQLKNLAPQVRKVDGKLEIMNIDKLYEAEYPSDLDMSIKFNGHSYSWVKHHDDANPIVVSMKLPTEKEVTADKTWEEAITSWEVNITSITSTVDRNATVKEYINSKGQKIERITYTIKTEEKSLFIEEQRTIEGEDNDEHPYVIWIYGKQANKRFTVIIYNLTERPSVEWLSQFGIKEYVDP